ncbi:hypothetical protein MN0502_26050 [Arthrobacter sp. MN05-02]|nr:hypothetical protein MN0502_26050 [Arthrobacter sp. MN05-02]
MVTTNILGDVVSNVVGDEAEVRVLMQPNADPHSFEISAQDGAMMRQADLIVTNGLGLEEGLQQHVDSARSEDVPLLVAGDVIEPLAYTEGESEGAPDPHFWTDPALVVDVVDELQKRVAAIDGIDPSAIETSTDAYQGELTELDATMAETFAAIPAGQRNLVTNHHVFGYLADRYDFRIIGAVIPGGTTPRLTQCLRSSRPRRSRRRSTGRHDLRGVLPAGPARPGPRRRRGHRRRRRRTLHRITHEPR